MALKLPSLSLTQAQVAWSISLGQLPSKEVIDQMRYLRQLGVPFTDQEQGAGQGHHLIYGVDQLVEVGLAIYATRRGMKPREAAEYLLSERPFLRKSFRSILEKAAEGALDADWVRSRGRLRPTLDDEQFLRLHRRFRTLGVIEQATVDEVIEHGASLADLIERYPDGEVVLLVPLKKLMLQWIAWALQAPSSKRGRAAA